MLGRVSSYLHIHDVFIGTHDPVTYLDTRIGRGIRLDHVDHHVVQPLTENAAATCLAGPGS